MGAYAGRVSDLRQCRSKVAPASLPVDVSGIIGSPASGLYKLEAYATVAQASLLANRPIPAEIREHKLEACATKKLVLLKSLCSCEALTTKRKKPKKRRASGRSAHQVIPGTCSRRFRLKPHCTIESPGTMDANAIFSAAGPAQPHPGDR